MALIFEIKVIPNSGRSEWKIDKSGILKCYIKSPAQQGKANQELIKDLAHRIKITQDKVTLIAGMQSRKKRIKIDCDLTYDVLLGVLGIDRQTTIFIE